jgi:hypothetical protein
MGENPADLGEPVIWSLAFQQGESPSHDPPKDTGTADLCLGALLFHARVY